jgi:hypothetical protein
VSPSNVVVAGLVASDCEDVVWAPAVAARIKQAAVIPAAIPQERYETNERCEVVIWL